MRLEWEFSVKRNTLRGEAAPCVQMFAESFCGLLHFLTHIRSNSFCCISSRGNDISPTDSDSAPPARWSRLADKKSEQAWMWISLKGSEMPFSLSSSSLPAAARLARVHRLSYILCLQGWPFQVPKRDVNQTHLLLLLWSCSGMSTGPFGCQGSQSAETQHTQREVFAFGQKVRK